MGGTRPLSAASAASLRMADSAWLMLLRLLPDCSNVFAVSVDRRFGEAGTAVAIVPIQEINEGATVGAFAVRAVYALRHQIDDGVPVVLGMNCLFSETIFYKSLLIIRSNISIILQLISNIKENYVFCLPRNGTGAAE